MKLLLTAKKLAGSNTYFEDIREYEERLKGQEEKENRKYLHFIFNLFDHFAVLRNSF